MFSTNEYLRKNSKTAFFFKKDVSKKDVLAVINEHYDSGLYIYGIVYAMPSPFYMESDISELRRQFSFSIDARLYMWNLSDYKILKNIYRRKDSAFKITSKDSKLQYFRPIDRLNGYDYLDCDRWLIPYSSDLPNIYPIRQIAYECSDFYRSVIDIQDHSIETLHRKSKEWGATLLLSENLDHIKFTDLLESSKFAKGSLPW